MSNQAESNQIDTESNQIKKCQKPKFSKSHLFSIVTIGFLIGWYIYLIYGYDNLPNESKNLKQEVCSEFQEEKNPCPNNNKLCLNLWKIVDLTSQSSIMLMIVVFIYLSIEAIFCIDTSKLGSFTLITLMRLLSVSAIPTGISLVICAVYDMNLIRYMSGVEIYIAFAGISIGLVAFLSTFLEFILQEEERRRIEIKTLKDTSMLRDNTK